jgi:hypothetical protein
MERVFGSLLLCCLEEGDGCGYDGKSLDGAFPCSTRQLSECVGYIIAYQGQKANKMEDKTLVIIRLVKLLSL